MKFLTYTNLGCVEICKNMLISAERVGIDAQNDFYIACLDNQSFQILNEYKNCFLYNDQPLVEYQNWSFDGNSGFRDIVKHKWKIIQQIYKEHKELCFVDSDIVFVKNPLTFIENSDKILFQSDSYPEGSYICSGFMVFNDSIECKNLIDDCAETFDDDQLIVNRLVRAKYWKYHQILNEDLFPNGNVYYLQNRKENAIIIHNNWMIGLDKKIESFKEGGYWYV